MTGCSALGSNTSREREEEKPAHQGVKFLHEAAEAEELRELEQLQIAAMGRAGRVIRTLLERGTKWHDQYQDERVGLCATCVLRCWRAEVQSCRSAKAACAGALTLATRA